MNDSAINLSTALEWKMCEKISRDLLDKAVWKVWPWASWHLQGLYLKATVLASSPYLPALETGYFILFTGVPLHSVFSFWNIISHNQRREEGESC